MGGIMKSSPALLTAFAALLMALPAGAQDDRAAALAKIKDTQAASKDRVAAGWKLGNAATPDEVRALQAVANDARDDGAVRFVAVMTLREDPSFRPVVLAILRDPANGDATLRVKLLHHLSSLRLAPDSNEFREVLEVMRSMLRDPSPEARFQAVSRLVAFKDAAGVQALTETLRNPDKDPVATKAQAIELLRVAGPGAHTALIRPFLDDPDTKVRTQAVLALGVDAESRDKIARYLKDADQPIEVRKAAIEALSLDRGFAPRALEVITSDREPPELRLAALERLVGTPQFQQLAPADQVELARVADTSSRTGSEALRERWGIARTALHRASPAARAFLDRPREGR
jgi:HEAT repeat protein